ncbi:hypothetical protein EG867_16725, partial [Enterococcus faecalis]
VDLLLPVQRKVGQVGDGADGGFLYVHPVGEVAVSPQVFQQKGEPGGTRTAKNGVDDEDGIARGESLPEAAEILRSGELVEDHRSHVGIALEAHTDVGVEVGFRPEQTDEMTVVFARVALVAQFVEPDILPEGVAIDPRQPELEEIGIDGCTVVGQLVDGFHLLGKEAVGMVDLVT